MHDCALAKIFFAWWEKLVVQVSVNRLLVVLGGRPGGSRWTHKECRAKRNVLPVHLIHIKPIIFGHPLSLYEFFIAVTAGDRLAMELPFIVKYRSLFRITVFNVRIMWGGRLWKSLSIISGGLYIHFQSSRTLLAATVIFCAHWKFVKRSNGTYESRFPPDTSFGTLKVRGGLTATQQPKWN